MKNLWRTFELFCAYVTVILCIPIMALAGVLWISQHYLNVMMDWPQSNRGLRVKSGSFDQERFL